MKKLKNSDIYTDIDKITASQEQPQPVFNYDCKLCDNLNICDDNETINPIFELPRISRKKVDDLFEANIMRIEDIPEEFPLTEKQSLIRNCLLNQRNFISDKLSDVLEEIIWPAYYLDFETVMTAIPLYKDIAPFTQIPTQYSIHVCESPGKITNHFEYLANQIMDCRLELTESLLNDLNNGGSIIVYSNFEKTILNQLIKLYPQFKEQLTSIIARLVDLEVIIKNNYYNPEFHGSTSIKKTLPVMVPELSYDNLDINKGDSAMAAFAYMALGKYNEQELTKIKKNLLKYCEQDTLAMVKIHENLASLIL